MGAFCGGGILEGFGVMLLYGTTLLRSWAAGCYSRQTPKKINYCSSLKIHCGLLLASPCNCPGLLEMRARIRHIHTVYWTQLPLSVRSDVGRSHGTAALLTSGILRDPSFAPGTLPQAAQSENPDLLPFFACKGLAALTQTGGIKSCSAMDSVAVSRTHDASSL